MRSLFWKFFFAFLLALLLTSIGVASGMWLRHNAERQSFEAIPVQMGWKATDLVDSAADIARYAGIEPLKKYLHEQHRNGIKLFAVNQDNQDILQRNIDPQLLATTRQLVFENQRIRSVQQVILEDGRALLLFIPSPEKLGQKLDRPKPPKPPLLLLLGMWLMSGLLFSALLAWWFTKPIRILKKAFNDVADGKLDTRISPAMGKRRDELAELGQNFDYMTGRISQLLNAQKRLLHDVSHELRSPLARMQAAIGLAQQSPDKTAKMLDRVERESERIDHLIGELLNLSRLENPTTENDERQLFDLTEMLLDIVEDARFEAQNKYVQITHNTFEQVSLFARPELIHSAIENVLRNAIKYSPENGVIQLTTEKLAGHWQITIEDQGPGIAEQDLQQIFQPFFRSRDNHQQDGIGLGLTIAHRAIEIHGGEIIAKNRPEGGLNISILLPV
ncbi:MULTISPECIES: sensor histidine kinase [unclassified Methylophaga]|jgi:two-component system OmpR family sensor kinase|uniref:sensor histidine kinase n=1 Tax=unclassified Methylophaga TaxID=2629249 RepID=UPI000C8DEB6B|nr:MULTISPECIES: ATP-binding protein [unclassified Methylophaga]MAP26222.1 two-component sensor histidine kinase [Methylophaga sp.]HBX59658.1 two-component sensor histidine kinase [Methylophaga sp.]HCN99261.1 two-component sensor histidine kinase [Methylophaga sp.]|tara:strand:+ start:33719 stop:35059 length:1341 start_codon:yes stop_codon:yes gene_type:complete